MRRWPFARKTLCGLAIIVLVLAGLIASLTALQYSESLANVKRISTIAINGNTLDSEQAKQILEKSITTGDMPSYVVWEERVQETLDNPALTRATKVNVVLAEGNVGLLLKGAFLPERTLPNIMVEESRAEQKPRAASSANGAIGDSFVYEPSARIYAEQPCLIDKSTALVLFGDVRVEGLKVRWNTQEFRVDGVLDSVRPLFVIRPFEQSQVAFNRLTVENLSGLPSSSYGKEIASNLGITAEVLEYDLLYYFGILIAWLPTLLIASCYVVFLLVQGLSRRNTARFQTFFLFGFLVTSTALTAYIAKTIELPREFIPSRFSDFALWRTIQEDVASSLVLLFDGRTHAPLADLFDGFYRILAFSVISLLLYISAIWLSSNASRNLLTRRKDRAITNAATGFLPVFFPNKRKAFSSHSSVHARPKMRSRSHENDNSHFSIPRGVRRTKAGNDDTP